MSDVRERMIALLERSRAERLGALATRRFAKDGTKFKWSGRDKLKSRRHQARTLEKGAGAAARLGQKMSKGGRTREQQMTRAQISGQQAKAIRKRYKLKKPGQESVPSGR